MSWLDVVNAGALLQPDLLGACSREQRVFGGIWLDGRNGSWLEVLLAEHFCSRDVVNF